MSNLGFGSCPEALRGSVRLYEPEYGRFLSTDVLWGKYLPLQPYQYAGNNPVTVVDPTGMAGEDPKEAHRVSSTVALGAAIAGVAAGVGEIVGGFAAMLTPTGVGQVGGAALVSMGVGTIAFSGAKMVDAIDAIDNDRQVADIPTGYGELTGGAVDKELGGSGELGQVLGGLAQGSLSGKLATGLLVGSASSAEAMMAPGVVKGVASATIGLEVVSNGHSLLVAAGAVDDGTSKPAQSHSTSQSRFETRPVQPDW